MPQDTQEKGLRIDKIHAPSMGFYLLVHGVTPFVVLQIAFGRESFTAVGISALKLAQCWVNAFVYSQITAHGEGLIAAGVAAEVRLSTVVYMLVCI